jgi:hypothetical protein
LAIHCAVCPAHTVKVAIVSTATTQSALLNHEIFLTEYALLAMLSTALKLMCVYVKSLRKYHERKDAPLALSLLCPPIA